MWIRNTLREDITVLNRLEKLKELQREPCRFISEARGIPSKRGRHGQ